MATGRKKLHRASNKVRSRVMATDWIAAELRSLNGLFPDQVEFVDPCRDFEVSRVGVVESSRLGH
jgi:hypothetical protein